MLLQPFLKKTRVALLFNFDLSFSPEAYQRFSGVLFPYESASLINEGAVFQTLKCLGEKKGFSFAS